MNDSVSSETKSDSELVKKNKKLKLSFFVTLIASIVVIAISIVLISTSWNAHTEAQAAEAVAIENLSDAEAELSAANSYYDEALSSWSYWYSCYMTTSWWYDWICGDESSVTSDLEFAETLVSIAESDQKDAKRELASAKSDLDDSAEQFNQTTWTWGALSALALVALLITGIMFARGRRKQNKKEELEARPDWDCPECSTHNEGGMFCVGCGFSKAEAKLRKPTEADEAKIEKPTKAQEAKSKKLTKADQAKDEKEA